MNRWKTLVLLATLTALLLWVGQALGGRTGLWVAFAAAAVMNLGTWWFADRLVLRMYHARELGPGEAPALRATVERLAHRAGLPMPRLYIVPEEAPNAFATGRDPAHGVVAVTEGLLRVLDRDETAAVIAHELGHIKHRDTLVMSVAATLAGALGMLANAAMWGSFFGVSREEGDGPGPLAGLMGVLIAPLAASLVQMSISRAREYLADEAAARFTGQPLALASALRKIEVWSAEVPMESGTPATAHLLIHNPFHGGLAALFSTHPSTEERIARLENMARRGTAYAA